MTTTTQMTTEPQQERSPERTASSAAVTVLSILLIALLTITLLSPISTTVRQTSVLLLAISLFLALYGSWTGVALVAGIAAIASTIAVNLLGSTLFGQTAGVILAILWVIALFLGFRWGARNVISVSKDRAIMIVNTYSGQMVQANPPIAPPLLPFVQRKVAEIPLYELDSEVKVDKVNTAAGGDMVVERVTVHVRYRVVKPKLALGGIPSRSQIQREVADQLDIPVNEARTNVAFWERLLSQQMNSEVDDIVRLVIRKEQNAVDAYNKSEEIAKEVRSLLDERVNRWGVNTTMLEFEQVNVGPELFRKVREGNPKEKDTLERKRLAEAEAYRLERLMDTLADGEARRVRAVLQELQNAKIDLAPEVIVSALRGNSEDVIEGEIISPPDAPTGEKKS